jgi:EAL domain-containing protein (putative c-di-GMP-specific phosphodiesterase class I)
MQRLTVAMIDGALREQRRWFATTNSYVHLAFNLSLDFLSTPSAAEAISDLVALHHVPAAFIRFEVTEQCAMTDVGMCMENIARLHLRGHRFAIDDFGVGYSSLQQLLRVPADELKLDRSFVTGLHHGSRAALMVKATIAMAHALGMRTVAEGIETESEWALLARYGCDIAQGYLLGRPMPSGDFAALLHPPATHER